MIIKNNIAFSSRIFSVILLILTVHLSSAQNVGGNLNTSTEPGSESTKQNSGPAATVKQKISFSGVAQIWGRYSELNEGTIMNGENTTNYLDYRIRRLRFFAKGEVSPNLYISIVAGLNNMSAQKINPDFKIFDLLAEYKFKKWLIVGGGKSPHTGPSRYASSSSTSIITLDIPVFAMGTFNLTDEGMRKMSVYAKGEIEKLNYRIVLAKPNQTQNSPVLSETAQFLSTDPSMQVSSYFKYQFLDTEGVRSAYSSGSYLGKKQIFTVGAGFLHQKDVTGSINAGGDTLTHDLNLLAADLFIETPVWNKKFILNIYSAYYNNNFGPGYIRNIGMGSPSGVSSTDISYSGGGIALPVIGTGSVFHTQLALFKTLPENNQIEGIQPYIAVTGSNFEAINDNVLHYEGGLNVLLNGHNSKFNLSVQNRPEFKQNKGDHFITEFSRKNIYTVQYQFRF